MIIHTYLTDGFFGWGEIFLKSYKYHNGEDIKIIMDTRDLNKKQIKKLKQIYGNIQIKNKKLDYESIAKEAGTTVENIKKYKNQIENLSVNKESKHWKLYISVKDRYRNTILDVMKENEKEGFLLHMDIDMYVKKSMQPIFDKIKENDISIRFRLSKPNKPNKQINDNRKVLGNMIGFRICDKTFDFMNTWIKHIDKIPLHNMNKGYGQASFYYAYLEHKDIIKWGDFPSYAKHNNKNSILWTANKGTKKSQLKRCEDDFNSLTKEK